MLPSLLILIMHIMYSSVLCVLSMCVRMHTHAYMFSLSGQRYPHLCKVSNYQWSGFEYYTICDFLLALCSVCVSRGCMHAVLCVYLGQCQHYHLSRPMCTVLLPSVFQLPWQPAAWLQYIIIYNNTPKHTHTHIATHTPAHTHTCTHAHTCTHTHTHT